MPIKSSSVPSGSTPSKINAPFKNPCFEKSIFQISTTVAAGMASGNKYRDFINYICFSLLRKDARNSPSPIKRGRHTAVNRTVLCMARRNA